MTTTATRETAPRGDRRPRTTRRATAGVVGPLLGATLLTAPALVVLGRPGTAAVDVAASFVIVAGLQVVVARASWRRTRTLARPAARAALLGRLGYAVLVTLAALGLVTAGREGPESFGRSWVAAAGVLGLGLLAHAVALSRSRTGHPVAGWVVAAAGLAAIALALVPGGAPTGVALWVVVTGETALAVALTLPGAGRHPRPR
ncbi:hypothetical protein [Arthrobacter sp. NEB 688]|uniref:hypothetical protein n=1 Tax=Arthrobacter sp. NEB 688 TaxID=904039 RepID=UPI00156601E0|nr:hypothetical protein [Arthrobacter sp. NEB 688]QKE83284.1 hypothetical protein HL663_04550 [Arthrobacter sp. NEB 688]